MNIIDIINKKRLKQELSKEEIDFFIESMMNNNIKDYQISSLLMAIVLNGMTLDETINLTDAMIRSGEIIDLSSINLPTIDKHSTGGVGDKVTLVLAPLLATLGFSVAKMSGRGLGHTGGTIDKLEAIAGYNVEISKDEFIKQVNEHNICVISQTGNLAPADKKLYALRDVTGTVESIPLIAASIMSKKIASGSDFIILDVKVGQGALMKNIDDALKLAKTMQKIGQKYNKKVVCILTDMQQPLGYAVGNSLEVAEAIEALKGNGPKDLMEVVLTMSSLALMHLLNISFDEAKEKSLEKIKNGEAYNKFVELVNAQSGDLSKISISHNIIEIKIPFDGYIKNIDALKIGELARNLGAGRLTKEDTIDPEVGVILTKKVGDFVKKDETILKIYYNNNRRVDFKLADVLTYYEFSTEPVDSRKLIYEILK